jgi:hypothetical protein
MIDPLKPLFEHHHALMGAIMPGIADPEASAWMMVVGWGIILIMALWAVGGLVAAVWTAVADWADRRRHVSGNGAADAVPR